MQLLDYLVLVGYFAVMIAIGIYSSRMIKAQEDFFMGGRSFGKLLQTFAAFGAGTGSSDPVNTGRTDTHADPQRDCRVPWRQYWQPWQHVRYRQRQRVQYDTHANHKFADCRPWVAV